MKIIAEIGVNHNGDIELAKRLVDAAIYAKADIVKFQTFKSGPKFKCKNISYEETLELKEYCDELDIEFMTSPHSVDAIDFVDNLVNVHKIASPFLVNFPFVSKINEKKKPVLLSTGSIVHSDKMASLGEIENAIRLLKDCDITLMHCVSKYPCDSIKDIKYNMDRYNELKKFGLPVGLSDHRKCIFYKDKFPILEKHIMLDKTIDCPDKEVSLDPGEFKEMVEFLKLEL